MYLFCPTCGNLLTVEEGPRGYRFACNTCPYIQNVTKKVSSVQYPKMKEVDDVLGGQAAWENVDSTEGSPVVALCVEPIQSCYSVCVRITVYLERSISVCTNVGISCICGKVLTTCNHHHLTSLQVAACGILYVYML